MVGFNFGDRYELKDWIILYAIDSLYLCLPIAAVVCGGIDLKRIRLGKSSKSGMGFDITGIVLGSVFILAVICCYALTIIPLIGMK